MFECTEGGGKKRGNVLFISTDFSEIFMLTLLKIIMEVWNYYSGYAKFCITKRM